MISFFFSILLPGANVAVAPSIRALSQGTALQSGGLGGIDPFR
jgi:hypothetical protein